MRDTLENFITKNDNGMFLLDSPTGFGKTTAVLRLLKSYLKGEKFTDIDRMFFVTNLKTNLPYKKLLESLIESEQSDCIWIKSYDESVIENWDNANIDNDLVKASKEYKALKNDIDALQDLIKEKESLLSAGKSIVKKLKSIESVSKKISSITEPEFRQMLVKNFFYNNSLVEKKKFIRNSEWFRKLYPICEMEKYKVIFMTTKKFCLPINLFYRMPFYIYDDNILKNSVVFIDEFDSSKKVVLNQIIENSLKIDIDIISLFANIHYVLQGQIFPKDLLREADPNLLDEADEDIRHYSSAEILQLNREKFESCYNDHNIQLLLKSSGFKPEDNRKFLFDDGNYLTVINDSQKKYLKVLADENESYTNLLTAEKHRPVEKNLLQTMLKEVYGCVRFFARGIKFLSLNYLNYKNTTKAGYQHKYTYADALMTVLAAFNLNGENRDYLFKILTDGTYRVDNDERFTRKGFKFTEVEDSEQHSLQSIARPFNFATTPENLMILIAQSSRLIGVSATASMKTVIGNYDLDYIESVLGSKYIHITNEAKEHIESEFKKTQTIYDSINIKVNLIDDLNCFSDKEKAETLLRKLFKGEILEKYIKDLNDKITSEYYFLILAKIAAVYASVGTCDIKSFVCFLNKLPNDYDKDLNLKYLKQILDDVASSFNFLPLLIFTVNSASYEDEMSLVYKELNCGNRCFVITTYQTIGSGKNIQYDIPQNDLDRMIIQDKKWMQKDFEGIYLITPTNLTQMYRYDSENKYGDLLRYLYQQQIMYLNKKITYGNYRENVLIGFKKWFYNDSTPINNKNSDLYYHTAQYTVQAVGRICRCKNKNKNIYIFADVEVVERLQKVKDTLLKGIYNSEFLALLKTQIKNERQYSVEEYSNQNKNANGFIYNNSCLLRSSRKRVLDWQELRDYVLKNPTVKYVDDRFFKLYYKFDVQQSGYSYAVGGNFKIVDIKLNTYSDMLQVSQQDCGLSRMLEVYEVRKMFEDNKFAMIWRKNDYLMTPSLYNQIYKGALGEVVGKCILDTYLDDEVEEIEDCSLYELFDFKIKNVYIDFKHWKDSPTKLKPQIEKIKRKLNRAKGEKAIIINILKRGNHKAFLNADGDILEIPYLINDENEVDLDMLEEIEKLVIYD